MTSIAVGACLLVFSSGVAFAARNPSGTGQPGFTYQTVPNRPGNSGTSPGSVFNEPFGSGMFTNTPNGGTGGAAYGSAVPGGAGAPSQYDVACFQQSVSPQLH